MVQRTWRAEAADSRVKGAMPVWDELALLFLSAGKGALACSAACFASAMTRGRLQATARSSDASGALIADVGLVVVIRSPGDPVPPVLHEGGRVDWVIDDGDIPALRAHVRALLAELGTEVPLRLPPSRSSQACRGEWA